LLYYYDIVHFSIYRTCIILLLAGKSLQVTTPNAYWP